MSPVTALQIGAPELHLLRRAARAHWSARPRSPFKLTWAVTWACQSGCRLCSIWQRPVRDELTLGEARRWLEGMGSLAWVDLTGGEPFLRDDLVDLAAAVLEACPRLALLHLPTNGLDPDRVLAAVRGMLGLRPRRLVLTVSIDGPGELDVDLRGHPQAWQRAVETLARLRSLRAPGFAVYAGVTLSERNIEHAGAILPALQRAIPGFRRRELHFNLAQGSAHYYGNEQILDERPRPELARRMAQLAGDGRWPRDAIGLIERGWRAHAVSYALTGEAPVPCTALHSSVFVDPRGSVYPCITWDRPLGNLRDVDFDFGRLWRSAAPAAADARSGRCPGCWASCEAVPSMLSRWPSLLAGAAVRGS